MPTTESKALYRDSTYRLTGDISRPAIAARMLLTTLVTVTTLAAILLWQAMQVPAGTLGAVAVSLLTTSLLAINITWLGLFFWTALFGWGAGRLTRATRTTGGFDLAPSSVPHSTQRAETGPTVIVMPIRHEDCDAIAERLTWMQADLETQGAGRYFSWYLLSDSSDPDWVESEARMVARLRDRAFHHVSLDYRRRSDRDGFKAGNLREFVEQRASRWANMIVLDADSLMSARRLLALEADLERRPDTAIIQTAPAFYASRTRWARLLEAPAATFGPMLARGAAMWQSHESNYWGHNAIIRIAPFREHAILPTLRGSGPLAGAIRSHDFVEAALLLRAGWATRLDPRSGGSWELVPPDPLRFLERDRRWMLGNLQHLRLLPGRGWAAMSRLHFLIGAMGYLIAPIWLAFVLLTVGSQSLQVEPADVGALVSAPGIALLSLLVMLLVGPRLLSLFGRRRADHPVFEPWPLPHATALGVPAECAPPLSTGFGEPEHRARSMVMARELLWMSLAAPVFMLWHSAHIVMIAVHGRRSGWGAQQRAAGSGAFSENASAQWRVAVLGAALMALALLTPMSPWVLPLAVSALLAPWVMGWLSTSPETKLLRYPQRPGSMADDERYLPPPIACRTEIRIRGEPRSSQPDTNRKTFERPSEPSIAAAFASPIGPHRTPLLIRALFRSIRAMRWIRTR